MSPCPTATLRTRCDAALPLGSLCPRPLLPSSFASAVKARCVGSCYGALSRHPGRTNTVLVQTTENSTRLYHSLKYFESLCCLHSRDGLLSRLNAS